MKSIRLRVLSLILALALIFGAGISFDKSANAEMNETQTKTLVDLGGATIAGADAYYDDGLLYYASCGNTIGYSLDLSSTFIEFDLVFDTLSFPGWFSLTLKASGFDRTQAAALQEKGYSFVIFASGAVEVWKPGLSGVTGHVSVTPGVRQRVKIGAINVGDAVNLVMEINGVTVINAIDNDNPYLDGTWFNICGDGPVTARLFSTKKEIVPSYYTYTLSTLDKFPTTAGAVYPERNNDTVLYGGTMGFCQGMQNGSVEFKANWKTFAPFTNVYMSIRAGGFARNCGDGLEERGYNMRIAQTGGIFLYKRGVQVTSGSYYFTTNTDYIIEFGAVDLDSNKTLVFVTVNGLPVASFNDIDSPIQKPGWVNINGEGDVEVHLSSSNTKLTPLYTKVSEDSEKTVLTTGFMNCISYTDMNYEQFTNQLKGAILINDESLLDLENTYYAKDGGLEVPVATAKVVDNKLIVTVYKTRYLKSNNALITDNFAVTDLTLKKTTATSGLICPSGFKLRQTYFFAI